MPPVTGFPIETDRLSLATRQIIIRGDGVTDNAIVMGRQDTSDDSFNFDIPVALVKVDGIGIVDLTSSQSLTNKTINGVTLVSSGGGGSLFLTDDGSYQSAGAATGNTLDEAYDQGGAGAGRTITVSSGAVELDVPTATNAGLVVQSTDNSATNNLQEWQDSAGTAMVAVEIAGAGAAWQYFGPKATDGSYRIGLSGGVLTIEKRVTGTWEFVQSFNV